MFLVKLSIILIVFTVVYTWLVKSVEQVNKLKINFSNDLRKRFELLGTIGGGLILLSIVAVFYDLIYLLFFA